MNGNVDEEGIRLDLEWMKRVGIGGAQSFEGGMNVPQLVAERVVFGSAQWQGAMRTAAETADRLGLELTIATSAGWSAAGAPWVEPADAMKKLVWSEVAVTEGAVSLALPDLPSVAGRYQDVPRWGLAPADPAFCRDIVTLAVPDESRVLVPRTATSAAGAIGVPELVDGAYAHGIALPRDPASASNEWIAYRFDEPVTAAAVTVGLPGPRGFGSPPPVLATLEASDDGRAWHPIAELPATQSPVRSRSFAPVTATWFRLLLEGAPAASALPPMDEGVLPLPFPPPAPGTVVTQFALWSGGRVPAAEEKAGFSTTLDYYRLDDRGTGGSPEPGVAPDQVIDISDFVTDGVLEWVAPPGSWRILRFGFSLTGHQNGPAPVEATGLEVDKLDPVRVEAYLERWVAQFRDAVGADLIGGRGIRSLLSDSIESGPQNWTETLPLEFERRRGYSLLPWLPVLAGYIVGDADQSDRVLWDFRQTIAELYSDAYYATVARVAHRWGLDYYAEALEDHRPQLGDDMQMRSHADVPMGAMWTFRETDGPTPTYVADLRGASSVAHVYGKPFTGAESMSSFGRPYVWAPRSLKPIADVELGLGVTRFCIHTSPHQPAQVRPPGVALTPHLGQTFTRNETWGELARPWIDYLARSSHLLNLGRPVADIAYFYGEEGPLTAVFGDSAPDDVPPGFAWDFVSADALWSALSVDADGRLVSRGAASYRVLYLGGRSHRMTLSTLGRIAELVAAGATVVGHPPVDSPSAADDPREFAAAVAALWANPRVITGGLADVLADPDWIAPGLIVVHRALDGTDIYFVSNPSSAPMRTGASFRAVAPGAEWWDAVTGTRASARAAVVGARTTVDIDLPAYGSAFLVLREAREVPTLGPPESLAEVAVTSNQPDDPGFSGTALWTGRLDVAAEWFEGSRLILRLEDVHDLAEVLITGQSAGVAWTEPFELDVTAHLTAGFNRVEIAVTNTWANRLIADATDPGSATTQLTGPIYSADAPRRPWGLRGPVTLIGRATSTTSSAY
jgi:hypothetical protein